MNPVAMVEVVRRFYAEVWNQHDPRAIPELPRQDFTCRGSLGQQLKGHQRFATCLEFVHAALADYRCTILETVREAPRLCARMRFEGLHRGDFLGFAPTGRPVAWDGVARFRFAEARVIAQLGADPELPTLSC